MEKSFLTHSPPHIAHKWLLKNILLLILRCWGEYIWKIPLQLKSKQTKIETKFEETKYQNNNMIFNLKSAVMLFVVWKCECFFFSCVISVISDGGSSTDLLAFPVADGSGALTLIPVKRWITRWRSSFDKHPTPLLGNKTPKGQLLLNSDSMAWKHMKEAKFGQNSDFFTARRHWTGHTAILSPRLEFLVRLPEAKRGCFE